MKTSTILAALAVTGTAAAAFAHGNATGIVKERMEAMEAMGDAVKAVTPMMRGETAYDAEAMRAAARTFQAHSGKALTRLFPEGTGGEPSDATDAVWSDWEGFATLARQLGVYARALEGAAGNGMAGGIGSMAAGTMMGGGAMMGSGSGMTGYGVTGMMRADDLAAMPADAVFAMTTQVCSACHSRFRADDD